MKTKTDAYSPNYHIANVTDPSGTIDIKGMPDLDPVEIKADPISSHIDVYGYPVNDFL